MPVDKDLLDGISYSFMTVVLVNCIRIIRLLLLLRHLMVLVEMLLLLRLTRLLESLMSLLLRGLEDSVEVRHHTSTSIKVKHIVGIHQGKI
jgi:hypothetical protein